MSYGFSTIGLKANGGLSESPSCEKRLIAHIDMDCFFASCEEVCDPSLKERPLIICGRHQRGVVTAANRFAKDHYQISVGMSGYKARQVCPEAEFIVGDLDKYIWFSRQLNEIIRDYSPLVEPYSIDELFLDLTGVISLDEHQAYGRRIKEHVSSSLGLPSTIGFGHSRYLAKMACRLGKPDGLFYLNKKLYQEHYWESDLSELWGIGSRGEKSLNRLGIESVGDLAHYPLKVLQQNYGVRGQWYHNMAWGEDHSEVGHYNNEPHVSYGHSYTLDKDSRQPEIIKAILFRLCDKCTSRMREDGFAGRSIHVSFETEYGDWAGHQITLDQPTQSDIEVFQVCLKELQRYQTDRPIRRLAMRVSKLSCLGKEREVMLFEDLDDLKRQKVLNSIDCIRHRFGEASIMRGSSLFDFRLLKAIHFQTARRFQSEE